MQYGISLAPGPPNEYTTMIFASVPNVLFHHFMLFGTYEKRMYILHLLGVRQRNEKFMQKSFSIPAFALAVRQFAHSEKKSNLANDIALTFRQLAKSFFHLAFKEVKLLCIWYRWKAL